MIFTIKSLRVLLCLVQIATIILERFCFRSNVGHVSLVGLRNIREVLTNLLNEVGPDAVQDIADALAKKQHQQEFGSKIKVACYLDEIYL